MADPASHALLIVIVGVLVAAGIGIALLAQQPERQSVIALASANAAGAVLFATWLAAADGFSREAAGLLIVVSAVLVGLAVVEIAAAPDPARRT